MTILALLLLLSGALAADPCDKIAPVDGGKGAVLLTSTFAYQKVGLFVLGDGPRIDVTLGSTGVQERSYEAGTRIKLTFADGGPIELNSNAEAPPSLAQASDGSTFTQWTVPSPLPMADLQRMGSTRLMLVKVQSRDAVSEFKVSGGQAKRIMAVAACLAG